MKNFLSFITFLLCCTFLNAQVPAPAPQPAPQPSAPPVTPPTGLWNMVPGLNDPLERVRLRDQDASMILDMIQAITGRYILRPQNLPQVKITFDSMSVLTKGETLLALESLLAMNGVGITKIDSQFYKAVPATGMNAHVPIWLDVPASSLPPSQSIYFKVFYLEYLAVDKMRDILNPFATPNVSSLLTFPNQNSIMITDSLINLQRIEKLIQKLDKTPPERDIITFWYETKRFDAKTIAHNFKEQLETIWKDKFSIKPQFFNLSKQDTKKELMIDETKKGQTKDLTSRKVVLEEKEISVFPDKYLGITCHVKDKELIVGILDEMDKNIPDDSDVVLGWFKPTRFISSAVAQFFESAWEKVLKEEFHYKPIFLYEGTSIQLGYYCHKEDEEKLLKYLSALDVELPFDITSKLIPLYHAASNAVAQTLSLMTPKAIKTDDSGGQNNPQKNQSSSSAPLKSLQSWQDPFFSEIFYFFEDSRSNGIFVMGTPGDVLRAEEYIQKLDTPLPMARIDTIFVMVDLTQSNQRGIDALFQDLEWNDGESVEKGTSFVNDNGTPTDFTDDFEDTTPDVVTGAKTLTGGLKVPLLNSSVNFELENWKLQKIKWNQIFSLASQREDVRIFSTPSITVSHGKDKNAPLTSESNGQQQGTQNEGPVEGSDDKEGSVIEIIDERSIGLPGVTMANGQTSQPNIQKITAVTSLKVFKPRIRKTVRDSDGRVIERGTVFMTIEVIAQKFDTTVSNTYEGQSLPSLKGRSAVTDLAIRDGQIMALGGFQEVQMDEKVSKYNFLSSIPYLGEKFFTPTQKRYTPTEMMIFIRPTIIDPLNPVDDLSSFNSDRIDAMMRPGYTPAFRSPSGKIFGTSENKKSYSNQDKPSGKPSL